VLAALIILLAADAFLLIALLLQQQHTTQLIHHMAKTAAELAAEIRASNEQVRKATNEVLTKIARLEDLIANGADLSAIETAVTELKGSTQVLDDVVPDAPTPEA
jgi:uncharacterized protein YoxC